MKVVHVIKQIEIIDQDIKDLKKLERSIKKNKSFTSPIYMTIEKQINIMLDERNKYLRLDIKNPPEKLAQQIDGEPVTVEKPRKRPTPPSPERESTPDKVKKPQKSKAGDVTEEIEDEEIPMLTQELIDAKIEDLTSDNKKDIPEEKNSAASKSESIEEKGDNNEDVKLLDIALEKGSLKKDDIDKEKEKKVRFFRENFPAE